MSDLKWAAEQTRAGEKATRPELGEAHLVLHGDGTPFIAFKGQSSGWVTRHLTIDEMIAQDWQIVPKEPDDK